MKFEQLVQKVNELYPDNRIAVSHTALRMHQKDVLDRVGDTLAVFIVNELKAAFKSDQSTKVQIEEARDVLSRAIHDLEIVRDNL